MPDSADLDEQLAALLQERARLTREYQAALVDVTQRIADLEIQREGLRGRQRSVTARGMVSAARAHISAGKSKGANEGASDPLIEAANAKGHTMRSLAEAVGVPASIISRARKGSRRIKRSAAQAIEKLTGFPATAANWPGGWTEG